MGGVDRWCVGVGGEMWGVGCGGCEYAGYRWVGMSTGGWGVFVGCGYRRYGVFGVGRGVRACERVWL